MRLRLVATMQFWVEVAEEVSSTPEEAWQRCIEAPEPYLGLGAIAEETAMSIAILPGVVRSSTISAAIEPVTGRLRATFAEQQCDEERMFGVLNGNSKQTKPRVPKHQKREPSSARKAAR